jgi:hypothetical protein
MVEPPGTSQLKLWRAIRGVKQATGHRSVPRITNGETFEAGPTQRMDLSDDGPDDT